MNLEKKDIDITPPLWGGVIWACLVSDKTPSFLI